MQTEYKVYVLFIFKIIILFNLFLIHYSELSCGHKNTHHLTVANLEFL